MAEPMPSLELVADEVRAERDAQIRHADAVDAKAGIILAFSGAVAALTARDPGGARAPGLVAAVLAALACLVVLIPRRFPTWELQDLRKYLRADREFTTLRTVDTGILMVRLKTVVARKALALRAAVARRGSGLDRRRYACRVRSASWMTESPRTRTRTRGRRNRKFRRRRRSTLIRA